MFRDYCGKYAGMCGGGGEGGQAQLKKVPSGRLEQVEFPAEQVTFQTHLPDGQESMQVLCPPNWINLRPAWGKVSYLS